jgi:hypothetical protein
VFKHRNKIGDKMDTIIEIEGVELTMLIRELVDQRKLNSPSETAKPYKLRVCIEGDTAKFKVNESTWSPPLGRLDPMCQAAQRRRIVT